MCRRRWIRDVLRTLLNFPEPYIIFRIVFPGSLNLHGTNVLSIIITRVIGIFISLLSAIGEKIGWCGFMVPTLFRRLALEKTLLVSSIFWRCWHLPLLIFGDNMMYFVSETGILTNLCAWAIAIVLYRSEKKRVAEQRAA